nr:immunoglobulin heavy chain junction region [Macaca mulatta]MOW45844.1 immunoglobulin heavy chain junction region [Macaca mulatta]MOW47707.1 immunoglobulin heavy chain junction region [Macaca mulatta]MOW50163.1 immunoglobulin heavy chain junction region [Macaca mulatta]
CARYGIGAGTLDVW